MNLIGIFQYILVTVVGIMLSYQMLLSFLALKGRKVQSFEASVKRRFAIIIPSNRDEKSISRSLYSLSGLVYPKNMYDLIVIADKRTGSSAMVAYKLGATVFERADKADQDKRPLLHWAFGEILKSKEEYDAIVVFDPNSLVSGNYLEVMNYYLDQGSNVVQGSSLVLPQPDSWKIEATRIGFLLYNFVKPLGRKVLGFGTGICGNGVCFSTNALGNIPWQTWKFTQKMEYGLLMQLNGIKIDFAPEATVWTEMPGGSQKPEQYLWERGRYALIQKYALRLLKSVFKKKSLKYFDTLVNLITPPLINTLLFTILMCFLNFIFWVMGWGGLLFFWMWAIVTGLGLLHLSVGLAAAGADRQVVKSVLYIPMFALWKLKTSIKILFTGKKKDSNTVTPERENSNVISE